MTKKMNVNDFYGIDTPSPLGQEKPVVSVSQLNRYVTRVLSEQIDVLWIKGEISNFIQSAAGHWYFTLKDDHAQVRAVMFRGKTVSVDFRPQNGMEVEVFAQVTLYEPRGDYQLQVWQLRQSGLGNLHETFLRLKDKLEKEGLFDARRKKPLPSFIRTVGIITSLGAAALQDVLTAIRRRAPYMRIIIYPSLVQGKEAPQSLINALSQVKERQEIDVLLMVRGGGSIEDLWAFNDEQLAREIAQFPLPVVSGVGHETDFTITDFVVDVRAPTPTAAAELVSVTTEAWQNTISHYLQRLYRAFTHQEQTYIMRLDRASHRLISPQQRLQQWFEKTQFLHQRLEKNIHQQLKDNALLLNQEVRALQQNRPDITVLRHQVESLEKRLYRSLPQQIIPKQEKIKQYTHQLIRLMPRLWQYKQSQLEAKKASLYAYNPRAILQRGYSITYDEQMKVVRQAKQLQKGQTLQIELGQGRVNVCVLDADN
ncbi:exodeoxyribonuclease VII large subunit [Pelistega ratti]|nr:exodeoxyribonuclease VII large subunit [Pelistega ratti]